MTKLGGVLFAWCWWQWNDN